MPYLLVPHKVTSNEATIWIGIANETFDPTKARFQVNDFAPVLLPPVQVRQTQTNVLHYTKHTLTTLQPRQKYNLKLLIDGMPKADANVTTLPQSLPTLEEKPFIVFLGSCFCEEKDRQADVGNTYFKLPAGLAPEIKILCGDQVYLDSPGTHYLVNTHSEKELEDRFIKNYLSTWTQPGNVAGFGDILKKGANFFSSDDHEFWNNAPNRASFIIDSWTETGRKKWWKLASDFYKIFQTESPCHNFKIGPLSFRIIDTRINRLEDRSRFMNQIDLDETKLWIQSLTGPGIVVVGQPLLTERTGFFAGRLFDWGIADYTQYRELAGSIASSLHTVVLLTGDVHFCRIATGSFTSGVHLVEIISSPMSLVDSLAKGKWKEAPVGEFPGLVPSSLQTNKFSLNSNHFMTLEFSSLGVQKTRMVAKVWPTETGGMPTAFKPVLERDLI